MLTRFVDPAPNLRKTQLNEKSETAFSTVVLFETTSIGDSTEDNPHLAS